MVQPFIRFEERYIKRLIKLKKYFLVSQTYSRAIDHFVDVHPIAILVTDYDDLGLAKIHLNALKHDTYASIIDLNNEKHLIKIKDMLSTQSKYVLYWSVVKDIKALEQRLNINYSNNMRRYIDNHTNWHIASHETIMPSFQITFGELYITLKRGHQSIRVKFEEIEKS